MNNVPKITDADLAGLGVTELPDVPDITASALKRKFEEIVRDVVIPRVNDIIDAIYTALPPATETVVGGIKAENVQSSDVQPVRIAPDGKLYTAAGSGGEYHVDDALSTTSRYPVQNQVLTNYINSLIDTINNSIALPWNATTTYNIGDYCIRNSTLFKSKINNNINHPAAENSLWEKVAISTDLAKNIVMNTLSINNATLYAYGKLRILQYPAVNWTSSDTVPVGHRPSGGGIWAAVSTPSESASDSSTARLLVGANGAIVLQINGAGVSEATQIRGQAVWMID